METINFGYLSTEQMEKMQLFDFVFTQFFIETSYSEECSNVILNVFYYLNTDRISKLPNLYKKEIQFLSRLRSDYIEKLICLKNIDWEATDKIERICTLITAAGRSFLDKILECDPEGLALLKTILDCLDINCCSANVIVADFFIDYIFDANLVLSACGCSQQIGIIENIVIEIIKKSAGCCVAKPDDYETSTEFTRDFSKLRENFYVIFSKSVEMIGADKILENTLFSGPELFEKTDSAQIEAVFYVLNALIRPDLNQINIEKVIRLLQKVMTEETFKYSSLIISVNSIISILVPVLAQDAVFFGNTFEFVVWQIRQIKFASDLKKISMSVSLTFEVFCLVCPKQIFGSIAALVSMFPMHRNLACDEDRKRFLHGIIYVLCHSGNGPEIGKWLTEMVESAIMRIGAQPFDEDRVVFEVEAVAYLIHSIDVSNDNLKIELNRIMSEVFKKIWLSFLKEGIKNFYGNERIMEVILSRLCKYSVRNFPECFKEFVHPILVLFEEITAKEFVSSGFIYLSSIFVEKYPTETMLIQRVLGIFSRYFFRILDANSISKRSPTLFYTLEDFYRLCFKFQSHSPSVLFASEEFEKIFVCAIKEMNVMDYTTFELIFEFLTRVVITAMNKPNGTQITFQVKEKALNCLKNHLNLLINQIVKGIYSQEKDFMFCYSQILTILIGLDKEVVSSLFKSSLNSELERISEGVRESFLINFFSEREEDERHRLLKSFNSICQIDFVNK